MNTLTQIVKIEILKPLRNHKKGEIIEVDLLTPNGEYWRRRLEDAKTDECCIVILQAKDDTPQDMIQSENEEVKKPKAKTQISKGE